MLFEEGFLIGFDIWNPDKKVAEAVFKSTNTHHPGVITY